MVTLKKQYKNHPKGTVLDVSPRIKAHLKSLHLLEPDKTVSTPKKEKPKKARRKTKAVIGPPAHRMIDEAPENK